jgi:hypothetical protein
VAGSPGIHEDPVLGHSRGCYEPEGTRQGIDTKNPDQG